MSLYSPSHPFFLDKIKEIYNIDVSLFFYLSKKNIHLPWSKLGGPMNFKMTTWKYCTSIVHELRLLFVRWDPTHSLLGASPLSLVSPWMYLVVPSGTHQNTR